MLVGTTSVEKSEYLSGLLAKAGVKHEVLNAKNHAREAAIVAQAGRLGAVTVATNMAGRGTDIMLGGNAEHLAVTRMTELGLSPSETPDEYEERWDEVAAILSAAAVGVQAAGADVVLLCTTSFHRVADQVTEAVEVPAERCVLLSIGSGTSSSISTPSTITTTAATPTKASRYSFTNAPSVPASTPSGTSVVISPR